MTVYLIRHGSAGSRDNTDPEDICRRLDESGRVQAMRLATVLAEPALTKVFSSPAIRCIETVEPLASTHGRKVKRRRALLEGADIEASWALAESLGRDGTDAALCSHGDIIPEIIGRARSRGMAVPGKSGCAKGSIWAMHWDGDQFTWGTYTPLPS